MKIQVTQSDIDKGVSRCAWGCPVYHALKRIITDKPFKVGTFSIFIGDQGILDLIKLPSEVTNFIRRFDSDQKVSPMEFELDLSSCNSK